MRSGFLDDGRLNHGAQLFCVSRGNRRPAQFHVALIEGPLSKAVDSPAKGFPITTLSCHLQITHVYKGIVRTEPPECA